jgi:hypothetical protein
MERDELMLLLGEINGGVKELKADNVEIKGRLCELEKKPAKSLEKGKWAVFTALLAILVTTLWDVITGKIK